MTTRLSNALIVIVGASLWVGAVSLAHSQTGSPNSTIAKEQQVHHATGTFEVKLTPQIPADPPLGRMSIEKQFHGGIEGTSRGQMLTTGSAEGSGGYVALEEVSGTLNGRKGTFVLQHSGIMTRGKPQLTITVVPDSGTGELVGLTGKFDIKITDGKHSYDFEYTLPDTK